MTSLHARRRLWQVLSLLAVFATLAALVPAPELGRLARPAKEAGRLFSPDQDGDLVRDDVGRMIRQDYSGVSHAALMQVARSWQKLATLADAKPDVQFAAGNRLTRAFDCAYSPGVLARSRMGPQDMYAAIARIRDALFDTPERKAALKKAEAGRGERPWEHDNAPCDFDPAAMAG